MKSVMHNEQKFFLEYPARLPDNGANHHHSVKRPGRAFSRKRLRCALIAALAMSATPFTCANAQPFSSIVAFGDSYADKGNVQTALAGNPALALLQLYYPNGRFSDKTNYVDTLSSIYGVTQANYAFGGAQTGGNVEFLGLPGFAYEWQNFVGSGYVIAPNALVTLNIGGNDARDYYIYLGGTMAGVPAAAAASASNAMAGINALVGVGAKTIVFTAGNVAGLPEAALHTSSEVAVGSAYSQTYNSLMQQNLAGVAASGVRVEYVDLSMIESNVVANPALYGLTYATTISPIITPSNSALVNQYLFYADGIHLTSAGFAIVAEYIANRLDAPETFAATGDLGLNVANAFVDTMFDRLELFNAKPGASTHGASPWSAFIQGNGAISDRSNYVNSKGYHSDGLGTTFGLEYRLTSNAMLGAACSLDYPSLHLNQNAGTTKATTSQLGLYGAWSQKNLFLQYQMSYGWLNYTNSRPGVVSSISANPDGNSFAAAFKGGYLFDVTPSLRVGPIAGLTYAQAHVNGYTENGDPVLTLTLNGQTAKSVLGSVGAQARSAFDLGKTRIDSYLNLTVENNFRNSDRVIQYSATSAPLIVNSWTATGALNHAFVRLSAGGDVNLSKSVALRLNLSQTINQPGGNDFFSTGGLNVTF
jgi:outer membrane lipase/esterase